MKVYIDCRYDLAKLPKDSILGASANIFVKLQGKGLQEMYLITPKMLKEIWNEARAYFDPQISLTGVKLEVPLQDRWKFLSVEDFITMKGW